MDLSTLRLCASLSRNDAARLCRVTPRTFKRWEASQSMPWAVVELLSLLNGDLSRLGWSGWRLGHDGLLYDQALKYGFTQGDIRRIEWDRQCLTLNYGQLRQLKADNKALRARLDQSPRTVYRCPLQADQAAGGAP